MLNDDKRMEFYKCCVLTLFNVISVLVLIITKANT